TGEGLDDDPARVAGIAGLPLRLDERRDDAPPPVPDTHVTQGPRTRPDAEESDVFLQAVLDGAIGPRLQARLTRLEVVRDVGAQQHVRVALRVERLRLLGSRVHRILLRLRLVLRRVEAPSPLPRERLRVLDHPALCRP